MTLSFFTVTGQTKRGPKPGVHIKDLTKKRFGRLQPLEWKRENERTLWFCKCDCGTTMWFLQGNLTKGTSQSCGCRRDELNRIRNRERAALTVAGTVSCNWP